MDFVSVYSQGGQLLGVLDSASEWGYELKHNDLWTGSFRLPAGDPKNEICQAHNLVRLPGGPRKLGLYRIVGMPESDETSLGGWKTYSLEHVMATLLDDVLFGYHEIGGTGVHTADVMRYILARQTTARWQLGRCEFDDQFAYHFENVSLLSALLSLGESLAEEYTWDFDTDTTPWTVSLVKADASAGCGIHYGRNLVGITKTMDAAALVTRLYPLGYGEGVNQLTIRDANNGVPYIDADTAGTWGVKASVWTDTRIEDPALLKARALQVLEGYKNPYITYTARALDLYRATGYSWDDFMPGKKVRVMDGEHGIRFEARIVSIRKDDEAGDPGSIEISIANAPRDAADSINTLADRVGIGELYSQGATNLFAIPFADNADATHPAKMRIYIPRGLVRINQMLLSWQVAAFRAYETGAAAGGSTSQTSTAGGGGTVTSDVSDTVSQTSESGGGAVCSTPVTVVSDASGSTIGTTGAARNMTTGTIMKRTTTPVDNNDDPILAGDFNTGSAGSHSHTVDSHSHGLNSHTHSLNGHYHSLNGHTHSLNSHTHDMGEHTHSIGSHDHGMQHTHTVKWNHQHSTPIGFQGGDDTGYVSGYQSLTPDAGASSMSRTDSASGNTGSASGTTGAASGNTGSASGNTGTCSTNTGAASGNTGSASPATDSQGAHTHSVPLHMHGMDHNHYISGLTIPALSITVPAHTHTVTIPGHTHSVSFGSHSHTVTIPDHTHDIVYGIFEGGTADSVTIQVDGTPVPASAIAGVSELDVVPWLSKDQDGKITRGSWHEIQIVPASLTRIEAQLFAQCFVQSVGGGDW